MRNLTIFILGFVMMLGGSVYAYTPTSGDQTLITTVGRKITALTKDNILVLPKLHDTIATVLSKLPADSRAAYILGQVQLSVTEALENAAIGQEYATRKTAQDEADKELTYHFFDSMAIKEITLKDDKPLKMNIGEKMPSLFLSLQNSRTGTLTEDVLLACGKAGFTLYSSTKATRIRLTSGSTADFQTTLRDPLSSTVGETTGEVSIECRVYDIYGNKSYLTHSQTLTIKDPDAALASGVLDIDLGITSIQEVQKRTLTGSAEDRTVNIEISNSGPDTFSGSVSIACYSPSTREKDDFAPSYTVLPDISVGPSKRSIAVRAIGTYAKGVTLECRLDPDAIETDENRENEDGKITFK